MQPVCNYLDSFGVQYHALRSIHAVTAQMTPKQILDFIEQPYVKIICEDAPTQLIQ